ncbi:hypothetical protein Leryth_024109 [Lithospermum erythrorhizon]|nr:hypothetical protein Leryth_024109 [Lithospermum erythrorhizon]
MEPPLFGGSGNPGDEALRWLAIAEKLLTARDLMGSKSFATRAREADPQLIAAYQILAVVDTLMASEKRINNQLDWYLILQLQPTHDSEAIATQYRRLAILLNPQKNQLLPASAASLFEAWAVLSNVSRKRAYDVEVGLHSQLPVNPLVTLDLTGQSMFGQNNQAQEFQFQIHNANNNNNASGSPMMRGFREEHIPGIVMGSSSGQMQNVGNIASPIGEDRMGNAGGYTVNNVWVSRDDGRGGRMNVGGDTSNNISVNPTGNEPLNEVRVEDVGEDNISDEHVLGNGDGLRGNETSKEVEGTFWTACPYCYHLFEYPNVYLDCTLQCQKCRKAFHGVEIASPPPIVEGKEAYFCCWGYMPLAVSVKDLGSSGGGASSWTPFSPMFTCPQKPGRGGPKSYGGPRFYHDDDDVYVELSNSSEGSDDDDDWRTSGKKKKTKNVKGKRTSTTTPGNTMKKQQSEKAKNVNGGNTETTQRFSIVEGIAGRAVNGTLAESSSKGPAGNTRRQSGRVANGRLDLNVEFSNETEEQVPRTSLANGAGHGNEDNFEGTGFFEGLDEFLSSLPILTGVGDDRVKAA